MKVDIVLMADSTEKILKKVSDHSALSQFFIEQLSCDAVGLSTKLCTNTEGSETTWS